MEKEEILKAIMELPKVETNKSISTMYGINIDDLMSAVDRFNKIPTYDELLRENKKQKEIINRTINAIDLVIELIKQQPTEDDRWILSRLNGFKFILEDKEVQK